jgi:hypothetical protein
MAPAEDRSTHPPPRAARIRARKNTTALRTHPRVSPLPAQLDVVGGENRAGRCQGEPLEHALGSQHATQRVSMVEQQLAYLQAMGQEVCSGIVNATAALDAQSAYPADAVAH